MKLVYIKWLDSFGCSTNWTEIGDLEPEPLVCESVGWLAYDGDLCKVVVPHLSQKDHAHTEHQGCGDMTIPTICVQEMMELQIPMVELRTVK
ncbi:MAG: hypothetical protein ACR2QC_04040 [Gammaproteobacteria bacterium]